MTIPSTKVTAVVADTVVQSQEQDFFQLGLEASSGHDGPVDLIAAHKWFNLAAARGHRQALDYRRELSREMTAADIARAQREAREFLAAQGARPAGAPSPRVAA